MPYSNDGHSYPVAVGLSAISYLSNFTNTFFSRLYPSLELPHADLSGKTVIVTGGNSGIGLECVRALAGMGARVVIACRDEARGKEAKEKIGSGLVEVEVLDLSRFESVRAFVERWGKREDTRVDVLINNAGAIHASLSVTSDGFEAQYQTNHLSHLLLTTLLLNAGHMAPDARIVSCSTGAFYSADALTPQNVEGKDVMGKYGNQPGAVYSFADLMQLYGRSKGAIVLWSVILQRKLAEREKWKDVSVHVCNPCPSKSMLWLQASATSTDPGTKFFKNLATNVISHSCEQGAVLPLWLATASEPAEPDFRGMYWDRMKWQWIPAWCLEGKRQEGLWEKWYGDVRESLL